MPITSVLDLLIAKCKKIGIAEGEVRSLRKAVLIILSERFKLTKVPKKIKSAIQRKNNPYTLTSLICRALDRQTLDEFAEALDRWS
jgi:hypothetical protein